EPGTRFIIDSLPPRSTARTPASGAGYRGSNPWGAAKFLENLFRFRNLLCAGLQSLVCGFSLGLGFVLGLEIQRDRSANQILQGGLIDLVAFVDIDGALHISLEAGVE